MKKAVDEDMGIDAEEAASTVEEIKGYIRRVPGRRVSLNTAMK